MIITKSIKLIMSNRRKSKRRMERKQDRRTPGMKNNKINAEINVANIDETINKVNQLIDLLEKAQKLIDSLGKTRN